jgi:asparagine synthase (glutamine-hydrolysing)
MCGIAGVVLLDGSPASEATLRRMTDAIAHRGPDGEGHWVEGPVGFGHRRLAVLDLGPAGHQPMHSTDGRFVLSYNGEVYNHAELRRELEALGHQFTSHSDSEVVLTALAVWGAEALLRFNGMFALALWDRSRRRLLLARDRFGIKPLYHAQQGPTFSFGSEQKAILAQPGFSRRLNAPALLEYFTFQNIFTDQTLLHGVHLLPAGHLLELDLSTGQRSQRRYWDYRFREPEQPGDREEQLEELDRLFRQAVSRQLMSDVELGAFLSGGMDSGSISALAARQLPDLKSFTVGFDLSSASGLELAFDERAKAEAMSARFKTEHYQLVLKAGDMERCLPRVAHHLEEPRVGQSYPNFYAARLASRFVKVVLAGTGGDELFGGYPWRYYRALGSQDFEHYVDQYYAFWQRLLPPEVLTRAFGPLQREVQGVSTRDIFRDVFLTHDNALERPEDYINHSLYFEAKTFLHGLFVVEDKLSMAHGLETRVPFMDNDLVDFAMQCPVRWKLHDFAGTLRLNENDNIGKRRTQESRSSDGKRILRDLMARYIPEEIARAEKQGFSAPDASWFKGESIAFVQRRLLTDDASLYQLLDRSALEPLVQAHLRGEQNHRLLIWSMLSVDEWVRATL